MDGKTFKLDIVAPDRVIYKGEVSSFSAPGEMGAFQVLYNHAPLLSSLAVGEMKVVDANGILSRYATTGGFVEVRNNRVLALVDAAERADNIDIDRARKAQERALERIKSRHPDVDIDRAKFALVRAINRIKVSERTHEEIV
jgi:F-type H+-transporting ATPase subunit epsilon